MSTDCMGGWCGVRDVCRHHQTGRRIVAERLCEPGKLDAFSPVRDITFRPQTGISTRPNSVFDLARVQALEAA